MVKTKWEIKLTRGPFCSSPHTPLFNVEILDTGSTFQILSICHMPCSKVLACDPYALWAHYHVLSLWCHSTLGKQQYRIKYTLLVKTRLKQSINVCGGQITDFPKLVIGEGLKFIYTLLNKGRDNIHPNWILASQKREYLQTCLNAI